MTLKDVNNIAYKYADLQSQIKALTEHANEYKKAIQQELEENGVEKLNTGKYSVGYITVKSTRLDQKKAIDMLTPEQRKECIKDSEYKRFTFKELKHGL